MANWITHRGAWVAVAACAMPLVASAEDAAAPLQTTASTPETVADRYGDAEMSLFIGVGWHPPFGASGAVRIDAEVVAQTSWSWLTVGPAVSLTLDPGEGPAVVDVGLAFTSYLPEPWSWRPLLWGLEVVPAVAYVWMRENIPDRAGASFRLTPFVEFNLQSEPNYDTYLAAEDELEALESERSACKLLEHLPGDGRPAIDHLRQELARRCGHQLPPNGALKHIGQSIPTRGVRLRFSPGFVLRTIQDPVEVFSLNVAVLFP